MTATDGVRDSIPRLPAGGDPGLSAAQRGVWLRHQIDPNTRLFNSCKVLRIQGPLAAARLHGALAAWVDRWQVLRSYFPMRDDEPTVEVGDYHVELPLVDLSSVTTPRRDSEIALRIRESLNLPYDLEAGPFFRFRLLRLGAEDHLLLLCFHHIVIDGISFWHLVREVLAFYNDRQLPPPRLHYRDYVAWQHQRLASGELTAAKRYWQERLGGELPDLELPADRPRVAPTRENGATLERTLEPSLLAALKTLRTECSTTIYRTLLAAVKVLLWRLTGQTDVIVGAAFSLRSHPDLADQIGFFVSTPGLRTDVSGDPRFTEILTRVDATVKDAQTHQDYPFDELLETLDGKSGAGRPSLYETVFLQRQIVRPKRFGDLVVSQWEHDPGMAIHELLITEAETDDGLQILMNYRTQLFDATTITRWATCLETLLRSIVARPQAHLSELQVMTDAGRHQLMVEWNDTASSHPRDRSIPELFEEWSVATPDAVAVTCGSQQLSYRELGTRADRMACHLRRLGVGTDTPVGLAQGPSLERIVALMAILKAGGAYVPFDLSYPPQRLRGMLEDLRPPVVLVDPPGRRLIAELAESVTVDFRVVDPTLDPAMATEISPTTSAPARPESLAYVVFTSGSTGRPKGVGVAHRSVVRLVRDSSYARMSAQETWLQLAPISFDASTLELWGPLLNGGRLAVWREHRVDLDTLWRTFVQQRVDSLFLTTSLFHRMVEDHLAELAPLRQLLAGGEVASPTHMARVREALPTLKLWNAYGPTENTTFTTTYQVEQLDVSGATLPIGHPLAATTVQVTSADLHSVPLGAAGELVTGGEGLARGYLGHAAKTAVSFVPDPFCGSAGERLYRTGDRARYRSDGHLEFLGRIDHQVKLRGFRIEPGEIEGTLRQHPQVHDAVVAVREDVPGDRRLVAYVTPAGGEEPTDADLAHNLGETLPDYMIPAAFVVLEDLPLSPTGKVDRRALPAPEAAAAPQRAFEAPRTPVEQAVAQVWSEVLGLTEPLGIDSDFFDLGGHSLSATRVVTKLSRSYGQQVTVQAMFERSRLADLAQWIEETCPPQAEDESSTPAHESPSASEAAPAVGAIRPAPRDAPLPLSFAQERLWFLEQLQPGGAYASSSIALELTGAPNVAALEQTFVELVRRHEVLRTTFRATGGKPVQVVATGAVHDLPRIDLDHLAPDDRQRQRDAVLEAEHRRGFDLVRGPLFRTLLVRLDDQRHLLVIANHHLILDAWTVLILINELGELYHACAAGQPSPLPPLEVQYADFAVWQRHWLESEDFATQLEFWRGRLDPADGFARIPPDRPRQGSAGTWTMDVQIADTTARALRTLGRQEGATLFMTLTAVSHLLLYHASGDATVALGTPIANRNRPEIENQVGFFVNTLVLRGDLGDNPTCRQLVQATRRLALDAYARQDVPFEKLVEVLQPERSSDTQPLFQMLLNVQEAALPHLALGDLAIRPFAAPRRERAAAFELILSFSERDNKLIGAWQVDAAIFDRTTAEVLTRGLERLLDAVASDPDQRIDEIETFSDEERSAFRNKAARAVEVGKSERSTLEEARSKLRNDLSSERQGLSDAKRQLLARRLAGKRRARR